MKRALTGAALILAMFATARAQSGDNAKEEVLAAQKRFYEAYRTCNVQEMEHLVTEDMIYLYSTGGLHSNKAEFLKTFTPGCGWDQLAVDVRIVRIYGDTAVLLGDFRYKGKTAPALAAKLVAMQVFVKQNGRWLFAANGTTESIPLGSSLKLPPRAPQ